MVICSMVIWRFIDPQLSCMKRFCDWGPAGTELTMSSVEILLISPVAHYKQEVSSSTWPESWPLFTSRVPAWWQLRGDILSLSSAGHWIGTKKESF